MGHDFEASPNTRTTPLRTKGRLTSCPICYSEKFGRWTWVKIVEVALARKAQIGYLPPSSWFRKNGFPAMEGAVYRLGKTWGDVREAVESFESSSFSPSRSGIRWRSKAEACLSDFLYARMIEHKKGRRYPPSYAATSGKSWGYYDLHFRASESNQWIDVEIWGGHPGAGEEEYERTRALKEAYHRDNKFFLGIDYRDCYSESRLEEILQSFIGIVPPTRFDNELDRLVPSSHWSTYEETLAYCKKIASSQPDGIFPSEKWLRDNHLNEAITEGGSFSSLPAKINEYFGGFPRLREILGQAEHNRAEWSKQSVLRELDAWMIKYGKTPWVIKGEFTRGSTAVSESEVRRGQVLTTMANKYAGNMTTALFELGYEIKPKRKKSSNLELIHRALQEVTEIGRTLDASIDEKLHKLVKKIYLYAGLLDQSASSQDSSELSE